MRLIFSLLILLGFGVTALFSQKSISGNLNQPKSHVVSIVADQVTVADASGFAVGDTILLIQMQGVKILTGPLGSYGTLQDIFGKPGMHEFLIISQVNVNVILFTNNIINAYNVNGNIQIVRVPSYHRATVTGKLFCDPWDPITKSGGVLALIVRRTLKLDADIDVSGSGFIGGNDAVGAGICWNGNPLYEQEFYATGFTNAGFKGEGIAIHDNNDVLLSTFSVKGLGHNFTGGGGGNAKYSGGGGGSNRGAGGKGGPEKGDCTPFPWPGGGNGGIIADHLSLIDRIYMGGGGGASTSSAGTSPAAGNGGGIVIILADGIVGNGGKILSNGGNGGNATGLAGSGGGGAAGSIALSLNSYGTTPIGFSASGGKGGNNPGAFGEGGGGGGGLIYVRDISILPVNVTNTLTGGLPGNDPPLPLSTGGNGELRTGFKALLNGFLFNSIRSSVNGTQLDSICSNMLPQKILGTIPVGGNGPYTYLWEKSYDEAFTSPATLTNDADPINYTPTVIESATVWYRRTVTSSAPLPLTDVSKPVKIVVLTSITNNIVGPSDIICYGQDPPAFTSQAVLQGGTGIFAYKWEVSLDNTIFNLPANNYSSEGYTPPPALLVDSWYRRTVTSGKCIDNTAIVNITVLPLITGNNILNTPPDICYGSTFANITATVAPALAGGDNTFRFNWESSTDGTTWGPATGANNLSGYNPDELSPSFPGSEYYRRVVKSGADDVCTSTSSAILLNDFPVITNNTIGLTQGICSGSVPTKLIGSSPLNGNGTYTFTWQDSTKSHTWTNIPGVVNLSIPDYQPPLLTDTTSYRRIVNSSACSDISKSIKIIVHKPILNNIISLQGGGIDSTICNGSVSNLLIGTVPTGGTNIPGDFAYQWFFSTDNATWNPVPVGGTGVNYQPKPTSLTTYYMRQVISGNCTVLSSATIKVTVLPNISNNVISSGQNICYNTAPEILTGATLSGGDGSYSFLWEESTDGIVWTPASGTNNTSSGSYQPPALTVPMKYRRIVKSGSKDCCLSVSNILDITIHLLPASPINAGPDTTIFSFDYIIHMDADPIFSYETGLWTVVNGTGDFEDNTNNQTEVKNLSKGVNIFLWTVTNGPCKSEDPVTININDLFIPEGFSPNNDQVNNTFIITGLDLPNQVAELRIINGAGTEVFFTTNVNGQQWTDWDGKNSKGIDLSAGTYYYLLKITSKGSGQVFKKSGFILLKRY